ncbi:unnamed protein product [Anisakis simplex]|uniref:CBS domain-containing protein n=1 Tax=Anisakis simplex TaxID=6269 RepID=A0A0M3K177_ANISI|nr:unnamed protein product [Anisakis simplex]
MIEIGELAEDALCRQDSPMNVYYHEGESVDSAHSSGGESSRRNSNPFGDFKDFVKRRRNGSKINSRFHQQQMIGGWSMDEDVRKSSVDSQFYDMDGSDEDTPTHRYQRRFSVPERVLLSADYAILRPTRERRFEVVAAFDKYADPYRHYMQSLMCYDLAPTHGAVVLIDSALKVHKALLALSQSGHNAAIIINSDASSAIGILTITDCLRVIAVAANADPEIGERTVRFFMNTYNGRKRLVTAPANLSVWDAARLFCLNHVHRIPVLQATEGLKEADVLYLLSLKVVFQETIIKLVAISIFMKEISYAFALSIETTFSRAPHLKQRTLQTTSVGTWSNVITINCNASCADVIDLFLEGKISCVAVVDDCGKMVGAISKQDIMKELTRHTQNYLNILHVSVMVIALSYQMFCFFSAHFSKNVYRVSPHAVPTNTIFETIGLLIASDQQCLFVVDSEMGHVVAAVAFIDLMEYILNSDEIHHKNSV